MTKLKGLLLTEGFHGMISQVEGLAKALDLLKPRNPNGIIEQLKDSADNFHIYTFGGLKETNKWLTENNYV